MARLSEIALLAHAALVNGGSIALLPEGEARVQRVTEQYVEASGKKQHVTLYSDYRTRFFSVVCMAG